MNSDKHEINPQLHKLWYLESIGIRIEDEIHTHVIDNIYFTGKRYSVGLPWKFAHKPLATNYSNSVARLKSQVLKLKETPEILKSIMKLFLNSLGMVLLSRSPSSTLQQKFIFFPIEL